MSSEVTEWHDVAEGVCAIEWWEGLGISQKLVIWGGVSYHPPSRILLDIARRVLFTWHNNLQNIKKLYQILDSLV